MADRLKRAPDRLGATEEEVRDSLREDVALAFKRCNELDRELAAQSAELEQLREQRDEFERKGKELCQAYGTSLIIIHDLKAENARLKAPVSLDERRKFGGGNSLRLHEIFELLQSRISAPQKENPYAE